MQLKCSSIINVVATSSLHPPVERAKSNDDLHLINKSGIHLSLHKVHGPCSPLSSESSLPLIDILVRDEERIRALNSRLTKTTVNPTSRKRDPRTKSVDIPLKPGVSINTGNYYINVGLGTPAKSYAMIVDTGSSLTWLQCQPCQIYCHSQVGPVFDPTTSNTYKAVSCDAAECSSLESATLNPSSCSKRNVCIYQASYGDSSYSIGYLSRDTLSVAPSETLPGFVYGCGQDTDGLFGKAAGLIGLSRNKLSMLAQLSSKYGYVFSYCLPTSSSTGTLSIGQSSYNPAGYKFTPMLADPRDSTLYFLRLTGITIAGKLISVSPEKYKTPTIIDSGTVITRLPATVYTALRVAFVKAMSKYATAPPYSILDTCFKASSAGMSVAEVTLMFQGGADLKLGAQNIVLEVDNGVTCLAFAGNDDDSGVAIIGNLQQETFKVAYDVTNSRIGFAAGGCR
ncbi:Peptidase A1 [Macleaya cordata]|uniref:Peptidase A1 n=1 Tax=Macleaya cordata TaxID=56857 RepID=A0A200Q0Y9_MACCD|nr:Peptidase A1 [Macleaya cordata]